MDDDLEPVQDVAEDQPQSEGGTSVATAEPAAPPAPPAGPAQELLQTLDSPRVPAWADVADKFGKLFPDIPQDEIKAQYDRVLNMQAARRVARAAMPEERTSGFLGRSISFLGPVIEGTLAGRAWKRIQEGREEPGDMDTVAIYERHQELIGQDPLWKKGASALLRVPELAGQAVVGSAIAGPALGAMGVMAPGAATTTAGAFASRAAVSAAATPLMPTLYAEPAVQKNLAAGRSPLDVRGLPASMAWATTQNMVLGSLPGFAQGVKNPALQWAARTGIGVAELEGLNALAGTVDKILPASMQSGTDGGAVWAAIHGQWGEAGQRLAVDTLTMAAFAALHGYEGAGKQILDDFDPNGPPPPPPLEPGEPGSPPPGEGPGTQPPPGGGPQGRSQPPPPPPETGKPFTGKPEEILDVGPNATAEEIKAAFKRAAWDLHPDRGGSHEAMLWASWARDAMLASRTGRRPPKRPDVPWPGRPEPGEAPKGPAGEAPKPEQPEAPKGPTPPPDPEPATKAAETSPGVEPQPEAADTPPGLRAPQDQMGATRSPREVADALEVRHRAMTVQMEEAKGLVRRLKQDVGMGLPKRGDLKAAQDALKPFQEAIGSGSKPGWLSQSLDEWRTRAAMAEAPPPAPPEPEPTLALPPGTSRLDRMRQRQQGMGEVSAKAQPVPERQPVSLEERYSRGEPIQLEDVFAAKGLDAREQQIIREQMDGKSFEQIAAGLMNPATGKRYSRQRAEQIANAAIGKLGLSASLAKSVLQEERIDRALELARRGKLVQAADLHVDADEVKAIADHKDAFDKQTEAIDQLADEILKEESNGKLSPERRAEFERRARAVLEEGSGPAPAAIRQPGAVPQPGDKPPPVRRSRVGRLQTGNVAPAEQGPVAPAAGDATDPAAPASPAPASDKLRPGEALARWRAQQPVSLLSVIKRMGGLDRKRAEGLGLDVKAMKESIPTIFDGPTHRERMEKVVNGKKKAVWVSRKSKGTRSIEDIGPTLISEGHIPPLPDNIHIQDWVLGHLQKGAMSLAFDMDRQLQREHDEFAKRAAELHEAARVEGASAADATEALRSGAEAGQEEGSALASEHSPEDVREQLDEADAIRNQPADGAADFDFGANAPLESAFHDWLNENQVHRGPSGGRAGTLTIPDLREQWKRFRNTLRYIADGVNRLGGQMFPTTTRINRVTGEALARLAAVDVYVPLAAEHYTDKVLTNLQGKPATVGQRVLAGAVLTERRLRWMRQAFLREALVASAAGDHAKATEMQKKRHGVKSIIGMPGSPFKTLADYATALKSPWMQGVLQRWNREFVPVMEDQYHRAQGLPTNTPIDSLTQVPGSPMNLLSVDPTKPSKTTAFTESRGNPKNVRLRKYQFAEEASGSAPAYEIDIHKIIENTLTGQKVAAKADAARAAVANGAAQWAPPGQHLDGLQELAFSSPPRGTQTSAPGDVLYVHEDTFREWQHAFDLEHMPEWQRWVNNLGQVFTIAQLASSVEATAHGSNLAKALFAPHAGRKVLGNLYRRVVNKRDTRASLMELARIGAQKPAGPETGTLVGGLNKLIDLAGAGELPERTKYLDPTYWMGSMLHAWNDVMRLTLSDAYDQMAKAGRVPNTEGGKRDFLNQWLGQYNKKAQAGLIRFLRDTGIGPFATATSQMNINAVKSLWGGTNLRTRGWGAFAMTRLETLGKLVAIAALVPLINKIAWDRVDGDEQTPFGAIKLGKSGGKTVSFDLLSLTGIKRGLRGLGLMAAINGTRWGRSSGKIEDSGIDDVMQFFLGPAEGPGVRLAAIAATGHDVYGRRVAETAKGNESQKVKNLKAAAIKSNPLMEKAVESKTLGEAAGEAMGPFGPKFTGQGRTKAGHRKK